MRAEGASRRFQGVMPYIVSPLHADGRVNRPVLAALCERLLACGVHGITPLGSTGEFAYLDERQRLEIVESVIATVRGRVPVIPGVSATSIASATAQARAYAKAGADGLLVTLDAYFALSEEEVASYFKAVADATDLPIIIYTNPNFQRFKLSVGLIDELSRHDHIVGLKDASSNTGQLLSVIDRVEGRLDVFAASSHVAVSVMMLGGKGWLSGPACLIPRESVALYDLCVARKWTEAVALQRRIWRLCELFAKFQLAACIKGGLTILGEDVGAPVAPQSALTSAQLDELRRALVDFRPELATGEVH